MCDIEGSLANACETWQNRTLSLKSDGTFNFHVMVKVKCQVLAFRRLLTSALRPSGYQLTLRPRFIMVLAVFQCIYHSDFFFNLRTENLHIIKC